MKLILKSIYLLRHKYVHPQTDIYTGTQSLLILLKIIIIFINYFNIYFSKIETSVTIKVKYLLIISNVKKIRKNRYNLDKLFLLIYSSKINITMTIKVLI